MADSSFYRNCGPVAFWNCNSISSRVKQSELHSFLARHNISVMMLGETWLNPHLSFNIPGYICYRSDRTAQAANTTAATQGGGTAILIRRNINHYVSVLPQLQHAEATAIVVQTERGPLRLISIYAPPDRSAATCALLAADIAKLVEGNVAPTLVAGDFNAKHTSWNSRIICPRGRKLKAIADASGCEIFFPNSPTYFPTNKNYKPDVLDIALCKNVHFPPRLTIHYELSSDHFPVLADMRRGGLVMSTALTTQRRRTNWKQFQVELQQRIPDASVLTGPQQIESGATKFAEAVTDSLNAAAEKQRSFKKEQPLTPYLLNLIRRKNAARRVWQSTRHPDDKRELNRLKRKVEIEISEYRNQKWATFLSGLNPEDNSLWRVTRMLSRKPISVPPLQSSTGEFAESNEAKAELLADVLESQFQPVQDAPPIPHVVEVQQTVMAALHAPADEPSFVTETEVKAAISELKSRKAPGPDGITNDVLKKLPQSAIVFIVALFNAIFMFQYFPSQWKHAHVLNFHKPGKNPKLPESYRPISLLNTLGKLCEKLILNRLLKFVSDNNIMNKEQFGFRAHHSTTHQLVRITDRIRRNFNEGRFTGGVFLDVASAFDKVWHIGLLYKLHTINIPLYLFHLIHSYLANRTFQVTLLNAKSNRRVIRAGVPQGSVIAPTLFSLYVRDIPAHPQTELALYADDTAVIATSKKIELLQKYLDQHLLQIQEWLKLWRIKVNVSKSAAVLFTRRRRFPQPRPLALCGENIQWAKDVKYLGVTLDSSLTFRLHIENVRNKARRTKGILRSLFHKRSKLSTANCLTLYKALIRPQMDYACPSWAIAAKTHISKLQVVQNECLRAALCAPRYIPIAEIHKDLSMPLLIDHMKLISSNFFQKAADSENKLISDLASYEPDKQAKYKRPRDLLE